MTTDARRIRYGPADCHFFDVYPPAPSAAVCSGAVMNIHGGFWRAKHDLAHAADLCMALSRAGLATFNVEYRRTGDASGGWPGTFDDVRAAFRVVRDSLGSFGLRESRTIVLGHSAGGHLALLLAAHEPRLHAAVCLAAVSDLHRAWELGLGNGAAAELMGGSPSELPLEYRAADPSCLTISAKQLLIHGAADDVVPIAMSRDYLARKRERGEDVTLVELPASDHFDVIAPLSGAYAAVEGAILQIG